MKLKTKYYFSAAIEIAILLSVLSVLSWVFGRIVEAIFFVCAYTILWYCFKKHIHFSGKFGFWLNIDWSCLFMSCVVAIIGGLICTLPLSYSIISSVPTTITMLWIGYGLAERKATRFNLNTCTEQELRHRCQEKGFSGDKTDRAVDLFIHRMTHRKFAKKYIMEEDSSTMCKWRLKKELKD